MHQKPEKKVKKVALIFGHTVHMPRMENIRKNQVFVGISFLWKT